MKRHRPNESLQLTEQSAAFFDPTFQAEWERLHHESVAAWESIAEDGRKLGRRGWTVPMWMLPTQLLFVTRMFADDLDAVFVWAYMAEDQKQFRELADGLLGHRLLEHWRPLLRQAISSYRRRQFLLVVPALLTILDGLTALAGERLEQKSDPTRIVNDQARETGRGIGRYVWASVQEFIREVFRSHDFSSTQPLRINRHWVLHGRDVPKWNRADCLRLFQALDTMSIHVGIAREKPIDWLSEELKSNASLELLEILRRCRAAV